MFFNSMCQNDMNQSLQCLHAVCMKVLGAVASLNAILHKNDFHVLKYLLQANVRFSENVNKL